MAYSFTWNTKSLCAALFLLAVLPPAASRAEEALASDATPHASIHEREWEKWRGQAAPAVRQAPAPGPRVPHVGLTREVLGFHPYWQGTAYTGYDWSVLSTVAFFGLDLDKDGNVVNAHGWPWNDLVATAHAHGTRALVTAVLFSSADIDSLLSSPARRAHAVTTLVAAVQAGSADGLCVDFENVPAARRSNLVTFMGQLHAALAASIPNSYVTIATPAVDWDSAFDYSALAANCEQLVVMAYDYHWAGSANTGPVAPLAGWGTYNVRWTVQNYLSSGVSRQKILLGVPWYGYRWPAATGVAGAATLGVGVGETYAQAAAGAQTYGRLWDAESSTPWYRYTAGNWYQGWYDDAQSQGTKYALVNSENLAGAAIWALGNDGGRPELFQALHDAFFPSTAVSSLLAEGPRLSLAGPNPFREETAFWSLVPGNLRVWSVEGREVQNLILDGNGIARWDGRDGEGRRVASGVYLVGPQAGGAPLRVLALR